MLGLSVTLTLMAFGMYVGLLMLVDVMPMLTAIFALPWMFWTAFGGLMTFRVGVRWWRCR